MKMFAKQTTPTSNLAFMGIFSAVLATFSLFMAFVPMSSLVIALFLPLISAIVSYSIEGKYLPAYIVGASALCLGVTFFNWSDTLFVVIPSILSGSLYGLLRGKRIPVQFLIFFTAILQFILNIGAFYLLYVITQVDLVETGLAILDLSANTYVRTVLPAFLAAYSIAIAVLNFFVIEGVLSRFSKEFVELPCDKWISPSLGLTFGGLSLGLSFVNASFAYLFFVLGVYFSLVGAAELFKKNPNWVYIILAVSFVASSYSLAALYSLFPHGTELNLFSLFFVSIAVVSFASIMVNKRIKVIS